MKITSDWHIHSRNSCDDACIKISDLISETAQKGILDWGLTDHIHTSYNIPDIVNSRNEFISCRPTTHWHFGVEVSCVSRWEVEKVKKSEYTNPPVYGIRHGGKADCELAIGLTEEDIAKYEIEFVVGGTHWPMYVPFERQAVIRDYHRQNMFLATHKLVDIVAHPWWWMGHWQGTDGIYSTEPWFDDFSVIPQSMHDEFAAAVVENHKVVEINIAAILLNKSYPERFKDQYLEYIMKLKSRGAKFSIGSDCHTLHYEFDFAYVGDILGRAGLEENDLWSIPPAIS